MIAEGDVNDCTRILGIGGEVKAAKVTRLSTGCIAIFDGIGEEVTLGNMCPVTVKQVKIIKFHLVTGDVTAPCSYSVVNATTRHHLATDVKTIKTQANHLSVVGQAGSTLIGVTMRKVLGGYQIFGLELTVDHGSRLTSGRIYIVISGPNLL